MRRNLAVITALVCGCLFLANSAKAGSIKLLDPFSAADRLIDPTYTQKFGPVGEFRVYVLSDIAHTGIKAGDLFDTFCLEINDPASDDYRYTAEANTAAIPGGFGGGSPDPLDSRTALLYTQFINKTLAGYDTSTAAAHDMSATALQYAIWYIENELSTFQFNQWTADHGATGALAQSFVEYANAHDPGDIKNVRVLNLTKLDPNDPRPGTTRQDLLALAPAIPTPAALTGGLVLLGVLGAARIFRGRKAA